MHLTYMLDYPELLSECAKVIKTGEGLTRHVKWRSGRVRVRMHAFSGIANQPKGLVISLAEETSGT